MISNSRASRSNTTLEQYVRLEQSLSHEEIREKHVLLDEIVRFSYRIGSHPRRITTLLVKHKTELGLVQSQSTRIESFLATSQCDESKKLHIIHDLLDRVSIGRSTLEIPQIGGNLFVTRFDRTCTSLKH